MLDLARGGVSAAYDVELRLVAAAGAEEPLLALVRAAASVCGRPVSLVDRHARVIVRAPSGPPPTWESDVSGAIADGRIDAAHPDVLVHPGARPVFVMPVGGAEPRSGWLVCEVSRGSRSDLELVLRRCAVHLAAEFRVRHRVTRAAGQALETLALRLLEGGPATVDRRDADALGIRIDVPRVVVYLSRAGEGLVEAAGLRALSTDVADRLSTEVLAVHGAAGAVLLIEVSTSVITAARPGPVSRVRAALTEGLRVLDDGTTIAGVSTACRPDQLRKAYREAKETAYCIERFAPSGVTVMAADQLGPARLFVANTDVVHATRYAQDVLGALLHEQGGPTRLLETLQVFVESGGRVRETAAMLCIHENTVRQRLLRIRAVTGLDLLTSTTDLLSAHAALLVLTLRGMSTPEGAAQAGR